MKDDGKGVREEKSRGYEDEKEEEEEEEEEEKEKEQESSALPWVDDLFRPLKALFAALADLVDQNSARCPLHDLLGGGGGCDLRHRHLALSETARWASCEAARQRDWVRFQIFSFC